MGFDHRGEYVIWRNDYHQVFELSLDVKNQEEIIEWSKRVLTELLNQRPFIRVESIAKRSVEEGIEEHLEADAYKVICDKNSPTEKVPYPTLYFQGEWERLLADLDPENEMEIEHGPSASPGRQVRRNNPLDIGWIGFRKIDELKTQLVGNSIDGHPEVFDKLLLVVKNILERYPDEDHISHNEAITSVLHASPPIGEPFTSPRIIQTYRLEQTHDEYATGFRQGNLSKDKKSISSEKKQNPCDSLLPKGDPALSRWKQAYSIYCTRRKEYNEEFKDGISAKNTVTLADFQVAILDEMDQRYSERTLRKIIKAGAKGCLK